MTRKDRYKEFIAYFQENQPQAETELHYDDPFQLLVAVVLSAQCTDKRINIITPKLFADFPTPEHLAATHFDELFPYIKTVSYPNNKTRHLMGLGKMLVEDFNSEIPQTIEELQKLPGVGRKTANVITSVIWNQPSMAVDTHVFRASKRIGLVNQNASTPLSVEKQLVSHLPKDIISLAHHWLILHGRYTCLARKPKCETCKLTHFCRYWEKKEGIIR
ncbi:MAG: endonuclease III [Roseivirga sp.]|nr:endonuclease III [Roseivirga sp.]